ncbi:hypothetical protein RhiirA4_467342 [Rhizophagus irregularis]|uniref:Uncharacterized protein n=1 Tax=Rhizophagus irregularis TaxID=588596 RepID=A0A2I1GVR7_9GLOM|nr:hypothetical protein RhiirA4_467342 [Rhizophagus irregularis]
MIGKVIKACPLCWKEWERFQVVLIGIPASVTMAILYLDNPAHSILTPTGKAFNLNEFTVSQNNTNTAKPDKKHKETKRAKKIDKSLNSIDKLTVLAEIRLMLKKLGVS